MLTLKNIKSVRSRLGRTALAKSPIWNQAVDQITPAQLLAFRTKRELENEHSDADALLDTLLDTLAEECAQGQIGRVAALDYTPPHRPTLLSSELRAGFEQMTHVRAAAVLFALETRLPLDHVTVLTWEAARLMGDRRELSAYARRILASQPRHIRCSYVFWEAVNGRATPVFGLSEEVFNVFGMVWAELREGYENLVLVDY